MNKKPVVLAVLAVMLGFSLGCLKKTETPVSSPLSSEILIGEYGAMTGAESIMGISTHRGVMMAVEAANEAGGIKGKKIRVITEDTQGKADEAVTVVTKLISQEKVNLLLGEVASSRSIAAGAVAQRLSIPMITPISTNPKVTQMGDYIFRVCYLDAFQGQVMAKFAANYLKLKKGAILRDTKSDYSIGLATVFEQEFQKLGGQIVVNQHYASGDVEFRPQLTAVGAAKPEFLFIPGYFSDVGLIARQKHELGLKTILLGGDGWDGDTLVDVGGSGIIGGYLSNHYSSDSDSPIVKEFVEKFKAKYEGQIPNGLSAMGYDAALIALDALRRAPDLSAKSIRDAIASTKDFKAVSGTISIDSDRNAVKSAVIQKVLGKNKYEYVTTIEP